MSASRTTRRAGFEIPVRVALLEGDADDMDAELAGVHAAVKELGQKIDEGVNAMRKLALQVLLTVTAGAVLAAIAAGVAQ